MLGNRAWLLKQNHILLYDLVTRTHSREWARTKVWNAIMSLTSHDRKVEAGDDEPF